MIALSTLALLSTNAFAITESKAESISAKVQMMERTDNTKYCIYKDTVYGKGSIVDMAGTAMQCSVEHEYLDSKVLVWKKPS
ncbi:hypothetical protein FIV04_25570 (plasmid) [Vibrio sp. THAF190c]|nr:hypothetical protein FIV04_25570 [Vibrio sp. THAF190c]